jgi:hypothetical protein
MVSFGLVIRVYLFIYLLMVYFAEAGEKLEGRLGRIPLSLEGVYRLYSMPFSAPLAAYKEIVLE